MLGEAREASSSRVLNEEKEFIAWPRGEYILRRKNSICERAERLNE